MTTNIPTGRETVAPSIPDVFALMASRVDGEVTSPAHKAWRLVTATNGGQKIASTSDILLLIAEFHLSYFGEEAEALP
jgi:hypothetical protein